MNKARLEGLNQLPISLAVTQEADNYDLGNLLLTNTLKQQQLLL
jgi:hypothetical protein